ncbi:hypothetical protein E3N88_09589 [Mikania micrantha]|uniref:PGG domain-containing protein n=1 Tax=Mikania micrantha TaxID=192012 RepID=A0A5N6PLR9_9ASTR|nr:hypothetical protein E3N88_09589 [Mikania micrantha]
MAGSSSSLPSSREANSYPYPSHVSAPNFVTVKLNDRDTYDVWQMQMMCLLQSHDMLSFISSHALGKEKVGDDDMLWKRSDALVKGWILGSLSQKTLEYFFKPISNKDLTAKDVWDKLQSVYGPSVQDDAAGAHYDDQERIRREESTGKTIDQETEGEKELRNEAEKKEKHTGYLYDATLRQNILLINRILSRNVVTLRDKITINGNTALHVAVGTCNNRKFLVNMLNLATKDDLPSLDMRNSEGSTPLHVAAIVGNTEAARLLLEKNNDLLFEKDNDGRMPVARALSNMYKDTFIYLLDQCLLEMGDKFDDIDGCDLLVNIISSKDYGSAYFLVYNRIDSFLTHIDLVLMAIAQNFPSKLNCWERYSIRCGSREFTFSNYNFESLHKFKFIEALEGKEANYKFAKKLLSFICSTLKNKRLPRSVHHYYNNALLEATRQNAYEVVKIIVYRIPNAIWSSNEDGHNIIQYAVINRSEKVYNLLYQMSEHKNTYRTIRDRFGNNLLHLAARLAPSNKLNPISGAALQLQFELQWFKEVESFVCPLNIIQKNWFGETPQMVFTKQHKDLVIDGEKWMKETAQSYTITAALITTIVFAAAITVPGGNKQEIGIPVFAKRTAFTISLFTSVTSLLMFLSILTARFSEQDFLFRLPRKLIIGLTTLFISTAAMLVAFGATLFLVFCDNNQDILIPIVALTFLPIVCFAALQFPLIKDLVSSTYFRRNVFGKKSDDPFY